MKYKQILLGCLLAFSTLACANSDQADVSDTQAASKDNAVAANQVLRRNADGERILKRSALDPHSFREVEVGEMCGKKDRNGVNLICHASASCMGISDEEPGICVAGPRARKTN